jgi:hypothetical protein|tara:strand:+ start:545 stop:832 length:288 start_codon:yes stop_codon:yes gene_type:complete
MAEKENLLKEEHFHGNNPDMKLDFSKPDRAEIDEMNYKKPITSYKDIRNPKEMRYMDGTSTPDTLNVDFIDDKSNYKSSNIQTNSGYQNSQGDGT